MDGYSGFTSGESLRMPTDIVGQAGVSRPRRSFLQALLGIAEPNPAQAGKYESWRHESPGARGSWWSGDVDDLVYRGPERSPERIQNYDPSRPVPMQPLSGDHAMPYRWTDVGRGVAYGSSPETVAALTPPIEQPQHRFEDDNRSVYRSGGAPQGDDFVNCGSQDAMALRSSILEDMRRRNEQAQPDAATTSNPANPLTQKMGWKQGLLRAGLLALAGPEGRKEYQQRDEFNRNLAERMREFDTTQANLQPEHMDTDEGPIQYNRRTGQWEPIMIGGQRVGPKSNLETTAAGRRQLADQYGLQGDDKTRYILTGQMPVAADKPNLDEQVADRTRLANQYGLKGPERQHYILTGQMPPALDKPASEVGSWQLAEDAQGNTVEYNTKTGQMRAAPPNLRPRGSYAKAQQEYEKTTAPALAAQQYAHDYLDRKDENGKPVRTGAGDEALMEKYFELARTEKGFRMTEPQLKMLKTAQSWMNGLEAKLRHATTGTWFSEPQRQQIVQTMDDLAKSKMAAARQVGAAGTPAGAPDSVSGSHPLDKFWRK